MLSPLNLNLTASLLAITASASASAQSLFAGVSVILRADDVLSKPYLSLPGLSGDALLTRRQDGNASGNPNSSVPFDVTLSSNGTLDFTAWDNITSSACEARLRSLARSSNPSGSCVCYNLPLLNTETGMFEADLRLYRVSEPRDAFAGVMPGDIQVGVAYKSASVSPMKSEGGSSSGSGSGPAFNATATKTKRAVASSVPSGPIELQFYMLVGQIDKDQLNGNLSIADLEALVIPTLTLTATALNGSAISTNVSLNEAIFLTGAFSTDVVMSDIATAQLAVADQIAGLKNGTVAFVLPGVNLMILPIGLMITSVWFLVGLMAFGFGTYERMQYASMYRRRASGLTK